VKISVTVKPNSKVESVELLEVGKSLFTNTNTNTNNEELNSYMVRVRAPPTEGKANERVVELLAKHFKVPKSSITLVSGFKSKKKIIEIQK